MSKQVNLNDPAVFASVISCLSVNDTARIRDAEKTLKPFLKTLNCLAAIVIQLKQSQDVNIRHHSALLLKKCVNSLYSKLSTTQREEFKVTLLDLAINELIKAVRTAIAG